MSQPTVTFLGDLKDCFIEKGQQDDDKFILRLNCGSPGLTTFASLRLGPETWRLMRLTVGELSNKENDAARLSRPLEIDLGWVRYLKILEIDNSDQALIQFDLGGMSNTFLGVTALKIKVDRYALAQLVPNHETKLMRERYQKLGIFRKWLWRRIVGKSALIGLPGVRIG